jgi:hypothetical protein
LDNQAKLLLQKVNEGLMGVALLEEKKGALSGENQRLGKQVSDL